MDNLYGNKEKFAIGVQFYPDPDAEHPVEPFLGSTWGSLQIWVDGTNLCSHIDDGTVCESVDWYFLTLFEWFIENWNPLFHEERLPNRNDGTHAWLSLHRTEIPPPALEFNEGELDKWESWWQDWWFRHSIMSARDGGLFPDIVIRRFRDLLEVSWGGSNLPGAPEHFRFINTEPNFKLLNPQLVAEPIFQLLTAAGSHLSAILPNDDRVTAFSDNVQKLRACGSDGHDLQEQRIAWLAGLGRAEAEVTTVWNNAVRAIRNEQTHPGDAEKILETAGSPLVIIGSCHAALMFGSMAPEITQEDAIKLAHEMIKLHDPEHSETAFSDELRSGLREFGDVEPPVAPWTRGYELARLFHESAGTELDDCVPVEIDKIIEELCISVGRLDLSDLDVRGVSIAGPSFRPAILLNPKNHFNKGYAGRRFSLAHELCHHLIDRKIGCPLSLASGPWAPRRIEQRANAFAAELLIPYNLIRHSCDAGKADLCSVDGIIELSDKLMVGRTTLLEHLRNRDFITEDAKDRFQDQLSEGYSSSH